MRIAFRARRRNVLRVLAAGRVFAGQRRPQRIRSDGAPAKQGAGRHDDRTTFYRVRSGFLKGHDEGLTPTNSFFGGPGTGAWQMLVKT